MDVIKRKHWWQSDQLKMVSTGLLGLLVGFTLCLNVRTRVYISVLAIMTLILSFLCWPVYFRKS